MAQGVSPSRLTLWDVDVVLDWLQRNETYARLRGRVNAGAPALSVQAFAEVLRVMRLRPSTLARLEDAVAEIKEQFAILELTSDRAEAYAVVADACRRAPDPDVANEAWFVWQVALSRREGYRILTKAPGRYRGLVDPSKLA